MSRFPQLPVELVDEIIEANNIPRDRYPVVPLAFRGYWLDTYGKKGENDRRWYDDALIVRWPDGIARFAWNTDPNGYRLGKGDGPGKGMASLAPGIHIYGTGLHKGTLGFRQCEPNTVIRDGNPPERYMGLYAINIHQGGGYLESHGRTSSEGCQTAPPEVWRTFQPLMYGLLDQYGNEFANNDRGERVRSFPYVLLDEKLRRQGHKVVSKRYL